jgi:hypothetical protein
MGSYVVIGSGPDLFVVRSACEDSGTMPFSVDAVLTGLDSAPSNLEEAVPGRISGLEVRSATGEERRPRALSGEEMTGFGEIELFGKSGGEGRDEVGLPSLTGDENCVPWKS